MDNFIVFIIIAAAVFYLYKKWFGSGKKSGCGCSGCSGCSGGTEAKSGLDELRKNPPE